MTDFYSNQRNMRKMRKIAMQRGVVAILDVGSSKIACLILRFDGSIKLGEDGEIGPCTIDGANLPDLVVHPVGNFAAADSPYHSLHSAMRVRLNPPPWPAPNPNPSGSDYLHASTPML